MSLAEILTNFVVCYGQGNQTDEQRELRSTPATVICEHVVAEMELETTDVKINEDTLKEVLADLKKTDKKNTLKAGQRDKLFNVIRLINAGKAPDNFNIPQWEQAYTKFHETKDDVKQELGKQTESLDAFAWPKGDNIVTLNHLMANMRLWGMPIHPGKEGAARYLSTERNEANELLEVATAGKLDSEFDTKVWSKLTSLLMKNPQLRDRVAHGQTTGRQLYVDVINILLPPTEFQAKKHELTMFLNGLHVENFGNVKAFQAARNTTLQTLQLLGTNVDIQTKYATFIQGISGVKELQIPYMDYRKQVATEEAYENLEVEVLTWGENGINVPNPTVAVRSLTTTQLAEVTQLLALSTTGGGAGGANTNDKTCFNCGMKGHISRYCTQSRTPKPGRAGRPGWDQAQYKYYNEQVKELTDKTNAMGSKPNGSGGMTTGMQKAPNTNVSHVSVQRPFNDNAGSSTTTFKPNNVKISYKAAALGMMTSRPNTDC